MQQIGLICVFVNLNNYFTPPTIILVHSHQHTLCSTTLTGREYVKGRTLNDGRNSSRSTAEEVDRRKAVCLLGVFVIGSLKICLLETRKLLIEIKCTKNLLN